VDDAILFGACYVHEFHSLKAIMVLLCSTMGMQTNMLKSFLTVCSIREEVHAQLNTIPPFAQKNIHHSLKYLGFVLNPNAYVCEDWN
jgi:hypothetical protein